jgi:hypothetical protein
MEHCGDEKDYPLRPQRYLLQMAVSQRPPGVHAGGSIPACLDGEDSDPEESGKGTRDLLYRVELQL